MEGTPHLLTDVKFSERRRGYAPDEVDNFLERVSSAVAQLQDKLRDATARAEEADARISEAKRAQTVAEAQVDQLKAELQKVNDGGVVAPSAPAPTTDPADDAEAASTLLVMAKKTADATIEEARSEAQTTLADAQNRASTLVADAEAESNRIRTDAERIAEDLVQEQRAVARAEVVALEEMKGTILADIDALQRHVERERDDLRAAVARLSDVIDNPAALRVGNAPVGETPGVEELVAPAAGVEAIDDVDDQAPVDGIDEPVLEDVEPFDESPAAEASQEEVDASEDDAEELEVIEAVESDLEAEPEVEDDAVIEVEVAEVDLTDDGEESDAEDEEEAPNLFAVEPDFDMGPPTQAFQPFSNEGGPDFDAPGTEDEDKAMRAFFETDFESMEADKRSRWRR